MTARLVLGEVERLRTWRREHDDEPEARVSLTREAIDHLLADFDSLRANRNDLWRGLAAIRAAHAAGGIFRYKDNGEVARDPFPEREVEFVSMEPPAAAVAAAGLHPWDRRAKCSEEERASILNSYLYYLRQGMTAAEAVDGIKQEFAVLADDDVKAIRSFLNRCKESLHDSSSPLARTFTGGFIRSRQRWADFKLPPGR